MTVNRSRIISRVLSPSVRLWLRTQVSHVEDLQVDIEGGDRQILKGYIPRVSLKAQYAVYQGLHLSQLHLLGENIRINLGQVLKGKPLHLLEPVPINGSVVLKEEHLKASLQSPLLSNALTELLVLLLNRSEDQVAFAAVEEETLGNRQIIWDKAVIDKDTVTLGGTYTDAAGNTKPVVIRTSPHLVSSHELLLAPLQIQMSSQVSASDLDDLNVDLGSEVTIEELTLTPGQIVCCGGITVMP